MSFADDAPTFLGDFGNAVAFGGVRVAGIVSERDTIEDGGGGPVQVRRTALRVASSSLTIVDVDAELRVDGTRYLVRMIEPVTPDGVFTDLWITKI